jgi:hypothetical protein
MAGSGVEFHSILSLVVIVLKQYEKIRVFRNTSSK